MKKISKKAKKIAMVSAFTALYITGAVIGAGQVAAARKYSGADEIAAILATTDPNMVYTCTIPELTNVPDHEKFECVPKKTTAKTEKPAETKAPAKTEKPVVTTPNRPANTRPATTTAVTTEKAGLTEEERIEKQLEFAEEVLRLCNEERKKLGLAPLKLSDDLNFIAQIRTDEQTEVGEISHTRPNGTSWHSVFGNIRISKRTWGENLIQGYASPEAVVEAWMNSPGHKANILRPSFKQLGVGVSFADDECTESYIVTQIFIG